MTKIAKVCRSLRASYGILNKVLTMFYVEVEPSNEEAVWAQCDDIRTQGRGENVLINADPSAVPETLGIDVVDEFTTVKMDIKGLVNYDAEIKKLETNLGKTMPIMKNLEKKVGPKGWKKGVKEDLKKKDGEELDGLKKKMEGIKEEITKFSKLK